MNLFVIGDVHGCCRTFKNILQHWHPDQEILIQLGDLIDRGNHIPETIKLARALQLKHKQVFFLKGNHEALAIEHTEKGSGNWFERFGKKVLWQYQLCERDFRADVEWFKQMPLYWENDAIFVSHAGIGHSSFCMDENHREGILWNRDSLKNIGKLQIIGHTPQKKINYTEQSHSWNIDTGAYMGKYLSGIKLNQEGKVLETISIPTMHSDVE